MYAIDISKYIQPLTEQNIVSLNFPDLNITDDIKDLTKMKLNIIRKKIVAFKLDPTYPTIGNSMFYNMDKLYKNYLNELDSEYGNPANIQFKYMANPTKATQLIKEREAHLKQFKLLVITNSKFIINNKDKILAQIDEIYNLIASIVADDLKIKRNTVNNTIVTCECGATSYKKNLATHQLSKRHLSFIINKNN